VSTTADVFGILHSRRPLYTDRKSRIRKYSGHWLGLQSDQNGEALRYFVKTVSDGTDVTCCGGVFHSREVTMGKARSPMVERRASRTTSDDDEAERWSRHQTNGGIRQRGTTKPYRPMTCV